MSKSTGNSALLFFSIKSLVTSIGSILLLNTLFSYIILSFDLDEGFYTVFSYFIVALSSLTTVAISTSSFKNNYLLMGMIAQSPIVILSLVNTCYNGNILQLVIKVIMCILSCFVVAILKGKKKGRVKL